MKFGLLFLLFFLGSVFATALFLLDTSGIKNTADDMVAHPRQVFDATTTNHHDRVLLEVVPFTRNIRGHLHTIGEADTGDFPESGVWFLGGHGRHLETHAALERAIGLGDTILDGIGHKRHRWRLGFLGRGLSRTLDELIDGRHAGNKKWDK